MFRLSWVQRVQAAVTGQVFNGRVPCPSCSGEEDAVKKWWCRTCLGVGTVVDIQVNVPADDERPCAACLVGILPDPAPACEEDGKLYHPGCLAKMRRR